MSVIDHRWIAIFFKGNKVGSFGDSIATLAEGYELREQYLHGISL